MFKHEFNSAVKKNSNRNFTDILKKGNNKRSNTQHASFFKCCFIHDLLSLLDQETCLLISNACAQHRYNTCFRLCISDVNAEFAFELPLIPVYKTALCFTIIYRNQTGKSSARRQLASLNYHLQIFQSLLINSLHLCFSTQALYKH